jgi:hypothetical protein
MTTVAGQVYRNDQSINASATYDIRPANGEEICIHNIYVSGCVAGGYKVESYQGAVFAPLIYNTTVAANMGDQQIGLCEHINYTSYLRVTNLDASNAMKLTVNGIYTTGV